MCIVPATISNNVPGTDFSLGADTAVNAVMDVRLSVRRPSRHLGFPRKDAKENAFCPL